VPSLAMYELSQVTSYTGKHGDTFSATGLP
jgi:hypothetical protein